MATRTHRGGAVAIKQVTTVSVADTWATSDTATLTINGRDLTVTIGSSVTTTDVATLLKEAVNSSIPSDPNASISPTDKARGISEFSDIEATSSAAVLSLTAKTAGIPFTVSVSEVTVGDGTLGAPVEATAATGPFHWDNADNWGEGNVPIDGDDVVFDGHSGKAKYGIDQNGVTPASIDIREGYQGEIGLPEMNTDTTGFEYPEYRQTELKIGDSADATNMAVTVDSSNSGPIRFDFNTGQVTLDVHNTGPAQDDGTPNVTLKGSHAANAVNVNRGSVGIAYLPGDAATVATLQVGFVENPAGDATVVVGTGVTLTTVNQSGGVMQTDSAATTLSQTNGDSTLLSGAHTTLNIDGGACHYRSTGTITTANVGGGGELDFTRDQRARIVSNCIIYAGATIRDPQKTVVWSNGLDLVRCAIDETTLNLGVNQTITPSAI